MAVCNLVVKYLFLRSANSQNFHPYNATVQQCRPQATNLNTKLHTQTNWQKSIAIYTADRRS